MTKKSFVAAMSLFISGCTTYLGGASVDGRIYWSFSKGWLFYRYGIMECIPGQSSLKCREIPIEEVNSLATAAKPTPRSTQGVESIRPIPTPPTPRATPKPADNALALTTNVLSLGTPQLFELALPVLRTWIGRTVAIDHNGSAIHGTLRSIHGVGLAVITLSDGSDSEIRLLGSGVNNIRLAE